MELSSRKQALVGVALMIIGTVAFLPSVFPSVSGLSVYALAVAALVLTAGTWLVGTSGSGGRPV